MLTDERWYRMWCSCFFSNLDAMSTSLFAFLYFLNMKTWIIWIVVIWQMWVFPSLLGLRYKQTFTVITWWWTAIHNRMANVFDILWLISWTFNCKSCLYPRISWENPKYFNSGVTLLNYYVHNFVFIIFISVWMQGLAI